MIKEPETNVVRRGPSPLPVHIGLALAQHSIMQHEKNAAPDELERMMRGIRKYQNHPFRRKAEPLPFVYENGEVRIFYCAAKDTHSSVLLVPSLINKSYIFDLLPEKSFARWLAGQGIDSYLLDWGEPLNDPDLHTMDYLITNKLCPAIDAISAHAKTKIHALGYCMGGTILAGAVRQCGNDLRSIMLLASPWDFHAGDRKLADRVRLGTAAALRTMACVNRLPQDWIQSVFAAVNADRALQKFSRFSSLDDNSAQAQLFVAVEDWLNDGVDLPADLARTCICEWYGENRPAHNRWRIEGKPVDLSTLDLPVLALASDSDRLVPKESAFAIANIIPGVQTLEPETGHVGMMTGRNAQKQVWEPLAAWIKNCS